jgi:hypothetical protein
MSLTSAEQNALLWPIKAKGKVDRVNPLGDPTISAQYQNAMEQGRVLESSIADANNWLLQKKQLVNNQIQTYFHMNSLAVDGQLKHHARVIKLVADSISILNTVNQFQQELTGLVNAVQGNLNTLLGIEASMLQMVQANLNALANLLNNICNWGLPALPSIPNLLPEGMWNWNGFNFAPLQAFAQAFATPPQFDFNFTFANCGLAIPGLNGSGVLGPNIPSMVLTNSGLHLGTAQYIPPLGGSPSTAPLPTGPVYGPTFNPNSSMDGAVPDPHTIVNDYQMPAATYAGNIVSIVPALRGDTVEPTASDYANPNISVRGPQLRKDLTHFINLGEIVATNYDPLITSAWLMYLAADRAGRGGLWLPNFQAAYDAYIKPSVTYLSTVPVPYNNASGDGPEYMSIWDPTVSYAQNDVVTFGGNLYVALSPNSNAEPDTNPLSWAVNPQGLVYQNAPVLPLVTLLNSLSGEPLFNLLWKLSYVEASLLGYTRNQTWDGYQDTNYLSYVTGPDLDYRATPAGSGTTTVELGVGTAAFPSTVTFPSAYAAVMAQVIQAGTTNILNDTTYQSPRLGNRYVYSSFAIATTVDRFSQFWRDFSTQLTTFLAQDPYLVQFAATYFGTLDGAVDPLGDTAAYASLQADTGSRNRSWTPGTPLLPIPVAPIVTFSNSSTPTPSTNGWVTIPTDLDANAFLSRQDVQGQPIPVQMAMLRTNLSYAALQTFKSNFQASVAAQVATATALMNSAKQLGFQVTAVSDTTLVPPGLAGTPVAFDFTNFDYTGNVTNPTTFTLQAGGSYAGSGVIDWTATAAGTLTVTVTQNGTPIYTSSADTTGAGTYTVPITFTANFLVGDVVQVLASHNLGVTQDVIPGSYFSMAQVSSVPAPAPPTSFASAAKDFTADVTPLAAATVVYVLPNGHVTFVDPTVAVPAHEVTAAGFPDPNGVTITAALAGGPASVGTSYGGEYTITGAAPFTTGDLLYVGIGGVLTNVFPTIGGGFHYVICVGRATSPNTMIYEPHIPSLAT